MIISYSYYLLDIYTVSTLVKRKDHFLMLNGVLQGTILTNLIAIATFIGLNGGLETLVPQAVGAGAE